MDTLKKQFLKVHEQYVSRRPFIQHRMEQWQERGHMSLYKQAKLLFDDAQSCEKEILAIFESDDWNNNRAFLKVKINTLRALSRELLLLTRSWWRWMIEALIVVGGVAFVLWHFVFGMYYVPNGSAEPTLLVGDRVYGNKLVYIFSEPKVNDVVMFEDPLFEYDHQSKIQRWWQRNVGYSISLFGLNRGADSVAKRIIAAPGDVIEGKIEQGQTCIYRNGKKINEFYVNKYPLLGLKKNVGLFASDAWWIFKTPTALKKRKKVVLYSYDPKKDFEAQPFYYIDYQNVLYNPETGYVKVYKPGLASHNKDGKDIDEFGPLIVPEGKYWVMGDNRRNSIDSREWGLIDRSKICGKAAFVVWSLDSEESFWFIELWKRPVQFWQLLRWNRFFKKIE